MTDEQFLSAVDSYGISVDPIAALAIWQMVKRWTGNDPEMGFLLEGANEGEVAAYEHGCAEAQSWLDDMLNKPLEDLKHGGHSTEKINEQRRRLIELREKAER